MCKSKELLTIGLLTTFLTGWNLPTRAEKCVPLSVVGGSGNEVTKTVTMTRIPGFFRDNWNTDWAIPNTNRFSSYKAVIVSTQEGQFDIKMYLKYSDGTADPFYEQNNFTINPKNPLKVEINSRRREQPYQLNMSIGGLNAVGYEYKAYAYGCNN
jgi:hypothetical protein